jgi:hypothetical protein
MKMTEGDFLMVLMEKGCDFGVLKSGCSELVKHNEEGRGKREE